MPVSSYAFTHAGETIQPPPGFIHELRSLVPGSATSFLEWGAGCSTLLFAEIARERGGSVLSIDDNPDYLASVLEAAGYAGVEGVRMGLTGPRRSQSDPGWNYGTYPISLGRTFDFILIDGRRRVECAVTSLALCHADTILVMHDYRRERYQMVTRLYDVKDGRQFRRMIPR